MISNAAKFTERGSVTLKVTSEKASNGKLNVAFSVADSGIGMSEETVKRLFSPFMQVHSLSSILLKYCLIYHLIGR